MVKKNEKNMDNMNLSNELNGLNNIDPIPAINQMDPDKPIPKKRGRKPKPKIPTEPREPKKRGRKPKKFIDGLSEYKNINEVEAALKDAPESNIILHLPINYESIEKKNIFERNDSESDNKIDSEIFDQDSTTEDECKLCQKKDKQIESLKKSLMTRDKDKLKGKKAYYMNVKLVDIRKNKTIVVEKTDILCWWCCHSFDTIPCFLPEQYHNNIYYVIGCFCTFNCALAYNVYYIKDLKIWERKSLLFSMCRKIYNTNDAIYDELKEALPRETLKAFGGKKTIEQFRKDSLKLEVEYKILFPPIISHVPIIEEDHKGANLDDTNEKKYKLQRNKPLKSKNSLETTVVVDNKKNCK
jgi:hypothetical protein